MAAGVAPARRAVVFLAAGPGPDVPGGAPARRLRELWSRVFGRAPEESPPEPEGGAGIDEAPRAENDGSEEGRG
jgi:hypothetical protein